MRRRTRDRSRGGLVIGFLLLALGALFLLRELGWPDGRIFFDGWWALILPAVGLARLSRTSRAKDVGGGVTLALLGAWLFAAHTGWRGLRYDNSWPLALVAVGAGMVAHALAPLWRRSRGGPEGEEECHV